MKQPFFSGTFVSFMAGLVLGKPQMYSAYLMPTNMTTSVGMGIQIQCIDL